MQAVAMDGEFQMSGNLQHSRHWSWLFLDMKQVDHQKASPQRSSLPAVAKTDIQNLPGMLEDAVDFTSSACLVIYIYPFTYVYLSICICSACIKHINPPLRHTQTHANRENVYVSACFPPFPYLFLPRPTVSAQGRGRRDKTTQEGKCRLSPSLTHPSAPPLTPRLIILHQTEKGRLAYAWWDYLAGFLLVSPVTQGGRQCIRVSRCLVSLIHEGHDLDLVCLFSWVRVPPPKTCIAYHDGRQCIFVEVSFFLYS